MREVPQHPCLALLSPGQVTEGGCGAGHGWPRGRPYPTPGLLLVGRGASHSSSRDFPQERGRPSSAQGWLCLPSWWGTCLQIPELTHLLPLVTFEHSRCFEVGLPSGSKDFVIINRCPQPFGMSQPEDILSPLLESPSLAAQPVSLPVLWFSHPTQCFDVR